MKLFVNAIELVTGELHFRCPVTVYAPTHTQVTELVNLIHLLDRAVACLALYISRFHVLRMVEINMVRQVVYSYPLDLFCRFSILPGLGIPAGIVIQFLYLSGTVHL